MKKFTGLTNEKKSHPFENGKTNRSKTNHNLHPVAKKKAAKFITILNYEYQESDLEQFVF